MGAPPVQSRKPLKLARPEEYRCRPCTIADLKFQQGICGERFDASRSPHQRAKVAPGCDQSLAPAGYILIPFFGKLHYVSPALFKKEAEKYHQLHWKEAWNLLDSIESNRSIYNEWINPRGFFDSFVAGVVETWGQARAKWNDWFHEVETAPKPDIEEFRVLWHRTFDVINNRLIPQLHEKELKADDLAKNGFDLHAIRQDLDNLLYVIRRYRENAIESAEQIVGGLETIESTSFQILNIVPILTCMDPFREAVYRIGVLLVRAAARGAGGYLATESLDEAIREAFAVLRREAPHVIVDVMYSPIDRLCKGLGMPSPARGVCVTVVGQIIDFTCAYYRMVQENADGKLTDQQLEQLLSEQCALLVGKFAGLLLGVRLSEKALKTLVKSVADSVISTLLVDINNARTAAKEQKREIIEVLISDLPGTIMRIVQGTVVGLIQRRAQQSSEFIVQQRAAGSGDAQQGLTYGEAWEVMRTNVGEWARRGTVNRETLADIRRQRRPPLHAFTYRDHTDTDWKRTNLDYPTAARIRRFAHDNNLVVIAHAPSPLRQLHMHPATRGAKSPKPMAVKAKTSNHDGAPENKKGLVVKPVDEGQPGGPTHKDFAAAKKTWDKESKSMFAAGYMVRDDGIVFHPDQLNNWAVIHPEDKPACAEAIKVLQDAARNGYHDLTTSPPSKLPPELVKRLEEIKGILNKARIGFYSDLDLVEVVDFESGARRFMGDKGDGTDALLLARDNRQHMNEEINIQHDFADQEIPDGIKKLARSWDQIQHGGSSEIEEVVLAKTFDNVQVPLKHVFMVFPGGERVVIDEHDPYVAGKIAGLQGEERTRRLDWAIRDRIEQELKARLGDRYQDFANRAQNLRKSHEKMPPRFRWVEKPPPPVVTAEQLSEIRSLYGDVEVFDEPGLGYEVTREEIQKNLENRRLMLDENEIEDVLSRLSSCFYSFDNQELDRQSDWRRQRISINAASLWNSYRAVIAAQDVRIDGSRVEYQSDLSNERIACNVVIAVSHYRQTIADAIEGLLEARRMLGSIAPAVHVWYELYTAYYPVCRNYVKNRIGGPDPGVRSRHEELAKMISCFQRRKNERLYAFATGGFADTYAPTGKDWASDKRPVQGMVLVEVWEHEKNRKLTYRKVETAEKRPILVFPECLIASP